MTHAAVLRMQGRLQQEYLDIQRRAQELMSSMDIPGVPGVCKEQWYRSQRAPATHMQFQLRGTPT